MVYHQPPAFWVVHLFIPEDLKRSLPDSTSDLLWREVYGALEFQDSFRMYETPQEAKEAFSRVSSVLKKFTTT
jgi:hypothetical protein